MLLIQMLSPIPTFAYDFEVDGAYYNIVSIEDLTCKITYKEEYSSYYSGNFSIPSKVRFNGKELTVIGIDRDTFNGCKELKSVFIPSTITKIESDAFSYCSLLEELSIPSSVTWMEHCCYRCDNLKRINIESLDSWCKLEFSDDGVSCSNPLSVAKNLYINGKLITDLVIPSNVTEIKEGAFYGCTSITSVSFEKGTIAKKIGRSSFKKCESLKIVKIPGTVTSIGHDAFRGCSSIEYVELSDGETTLNYSTDYIDNTSIFEDCREMEKIYIGRPSTKNNYTNDAQLFGYRNDSNYPRFNGVSVKELIIGDAIESFEANGKSGLENTHGISFQSLNSLTLGKSLKYYGRKEYDYSYLKYAELITIVRAKSTIPPVMYTEFNNKVYLYATLFVPKGSLALYQSSDVWKNFWNIKEVDNFEEANIYFDFNISSTAGGTVNVLNNNLSNTSLSAPIKEGESITIAITPNKGYSLKSLIVNGKDVSTDAVDNTYTIPTINQSISVEVNFAELPIYLTIKSAENGSIAQEVENGKSYTFLITPSKGWQIESISFNGSDVTSRMSKSSYKTPTIIDDSELNIVYKQVESSAIQASKSKSNVKVYASYGKLTVENYGSARNLSIYSISGLKVAFESVGTGSTTLDLPMNNIYIVKVGEETFKISM